jgi:hypothetical protein
LSILLHQMEDAGNPLDSQSAIPPKLNLPVLPIKACNMRIYCV